MNAPLKIDFVSDVACPWCAIGLASLEEALRRLDGQVQAELHFQPFELNPNMPPGGQDIAEHLTQKYGSTPEQQAANRENIRQRGEALGFMFRKQGRSRAWNTFDCHRLLHWAGLEGPAQQLALKKALLQAYHGQGLVMEDPEVLAQAAEAAGMDGRRAREILAGDEFASAVSQSESYFLDHGIQAVPSVIINDRHLIQGGQPPEAFEQALLKVQALSR
ncbi:MAG: DsbA family oxidoreductase [Comamonadaceae bacterium]|nr:MAG: DsbA family oxidoreductase [Comamonadaceae bacterium]